MSQLEAGQKTIANQRTNATKSDKVKQTKTIWKLQLFIIFNVHIYICIGVQTILALASGLGIDFQIEFRERGNTNAKRTFSNKTQVSVENKKAN